LRMRHNEFLIVEEGAIQNRKAPKTMRYDTEGRVLTAADAQ
jgi:hypothetical protein